MDRECEAADITVAFADTSWQLAKKLAPALLSPPDGTHGRGYTYAFLILNERLSDAAEAQAEEVGAQILGPHRLTLKARVSMDLARLMAPRVKEMGEF